MSSANSPTPSPPSPETAKSDTRDQTKWQCPRCDKTSYESEYRGWQAIGTILRGDGRKDYVPKRVYPCPYGEGFHLTSRDHWAT